MNIIKLSVVIVLTLSAQAFAEANLSNSEDTKHSVSDTEVKINLHARFFGFHDPKRYVNFAGGMNKLISGKLVLGSEIFNEPIYKNTIGSGISFSSLSAEQKASLASLIQYRRSILASNLGINVSGLDGLMHRYSAYVELHRKLSGIPKSHVYLSSDEDEDEEVEIIEVTGSRLGTWGGYASVGMSIGLADLAASSGIGQWEIFTVYFSSRDTYQDFQYNNFSGAWSIGDEAPCIDDSCHEAPQIPL